MASVARVAARALRAGRGAGRRVDRRRSAQRRARGGGGIQASRKPRARIALAAGSVAAYAGVLAYAAARQSGLAPFVVGIGAVGGVLLAARPVRGVVELLPWAVVTARRRLHDLARRARLGRGRWRSRSSRRGSSSAAELAAWSLDEEHAIAAERPVVVARATALAALVLAGLAAGGLVVALSLAPGSGLAWTVLGAAASVLVVAAAVRLPRRSS